VKINIDFIFLEKLYQKKCKNVACNVSEKCKNVACSVTEKCKNVACNVSG